MADASCQSAQRYRSAGGDERFSRSETPDFVAPLHRIVLCSSGVTSRPDACSLTRTPSRYLRKSPPASESSFSRAAYNLSSIGLRVIFIILKKHSRRINQQIRKSKFFQCLVDTGKCVAVGNVPTVLRQQKLYTANGSGCDMKRVQTCAFAGISEREINSSAITSIRESVGIKSISCNIASRAAAAIGSPIAASSNTNCDVTTRNFGRSIFHQSRACCYGNASFGLELVHAAAWLMIDVSM